ncbi:MAG: MBOAT family protein, partial [Gammaproteobacteria bacterium]
MLFNSIEFLVFLPTVFLLYWLLLGSYRRAQNFLIVVASYIFYGWWDWRFLSLIILSTAVDYILALNIARAKTEVVRKGMLIASLTINLGILGFFKYWNFFVDSWLEVWDVAGVSMDPATVQLILPVGISFYTFQTLSYTIDVYRRRLEPTNDVISFAAFVAFFPQLVAGPIERATNLLPQFFRPRVFTFRDGAEGLRQILWGMFKKVAIADQLAPHVEQIFSNYQSQSSV